MEIKVDKLKGMAGMETSFTNKMEIMHLKDILITTTVIQERNL